MHVHDTRGPSSTGAAYNPYAALDGAGPWSELWSALGDEGMEAAGEEEDEDEEEGGKAWNAGNDGGGEPVHWGSLHMLQNASGALAGQLSGLHLGPAQGQSPWPPSPQGSTPREEGSSEEAKEEIVEGAEEVEEEDGGWEAGPVHPGHAVASPERKREGPEGEAAPHTDRDLEELAHVRDVWGLSRKERMRMVAHWCQSLDGAAGAELKEDLRQLET